MCGTPNRLLSGLGAKYHRRRGWGARLRRGVPLLVGAITLAALSPYLLEGGPSDRSGSGTAQSVVPHRPPYGTMFPAAPRTTVSKRADFRNHQASDDARRIADWVVDSDDHHGLPFVIVDKVNAKVFAFDTQGRLTGSAPALLGIQKGDASSPGIGSKELRDITVGERTTPAGRFVAELGHNLSGEDVVWVDYDAGLSMHRVLRTNPREHRQHRLDTPTVADNRISYGCINVPVDFYEHVIRPAFLRGRGVVYILPEVKSTRDVFAAYALYERAAAVRPARHVVTNEPAG